MAAAAVSTNLKIATRELIMFVGEQAEAAAASENELQEQLILERARARADREEMDALRDSVRARTSYSCEINHYALIMEVQTLRDLVRACHHVFVCVIRLMITCTLAEIFAERLHEIVDHALLMRRKGS